MYQIIIQNNCQKFRLKLGDYDYNKIKDKILLLENNPRPRGCLQLSDWQQYRIRCGNYRIVYEIDDDRKIVYVYKINHRKMFIRKNKKDIQYYFKNSSGIMIFFSKALPPRRAFLFQKPYFY